VFAEPGNGTHDEYTPATEKRHGSVVFFWSGDLIGLDKWPSQNEVLKKFIMKKLAN